MGRKSCSVPVNVIRGVELHDVKASDPGRSGQSAEGDTQLPRPQSGGIGRTDAGGMRDVKDIQIEADEELAGSWRV